jgi:Phosphosulfolactate phosphohydrolase and related enzymes
MPSPADQSRYQVRFEWAVSGLRRLAASDVVIVIDVLATSAARRECIAELATTLSPDSTVLEGSLRNAGGAAAAVLAEQRRRGARTSVAVIACGEVDAPAGEDVRFAVEDLLGAGAIIDALGARGIDHTSPEAAAAAEAFRGLRAATRHLLTASATGQQLIEGGRVMRCSPPRWWMPRRPCPCSRTDGSSREV